MASVYGNLFGDLNLWILVFLISVFFIAGFIDSIAGGGGLLSIPALLLVGISPQYALGTNKLVVIFGTTTALINFAHHKKIAYKITFIAIGFSLIGAYVGTRLILSFAPEKIATIVLVLLPISALIALFPKRYAQNNFADFNNLQIFFYTPLISLSIGAYDGFFGPGTGTFLILGFYLLLHMDLVYASGSSKAVNLASGIGSFIAFAFSGDILYTLSIPLIIANIVGGYSGSKFAIKKGSGAVRAFVAISFCMAFISLVFKYFT